MIDPIGLSLEGFDVTGAWRINDDSSRVDPSTTFYDGTVMSGPEDLRQVLLSYSEAFLSTFTQNLMTYALGKRIEYGNMPLVRKVAREAAVEDNRFSAFIFAIVRSEAFRSNRLEPVLIER